MTGRSMRVGAAMLALALTHAAQAADDQDSPPACRATPEARALDFWTGHYKVLSNDGDRTLYGENRIEPSLDGCAIIENWRSSQGGEGKSLFYFDARANSWSQVWVTPMTDRPGGLKLKQMIGLYDDGAVRFQGTLVADDSSRILDRTTLSPLKDGSFRQLIEISTDGGNTWQTNFDALYLPIDR